MQQDRCCICEVKLPNRFSRAGRCEEPGCDRVFCALHWNRSTHRCRDHGYVEKEPIREDAAMSDEPVQDKTSRMEKTKKAVHDGFAILRKAGTGAAALVKKLRKDRSPAALIGAIDQQLEQTTGRKESASAEVEKLHALIVEKKTALKQASRARQDILQEELKSLLTRYNAAKRTYKILLENERNMALVKGRLEEVAAYGETPVSEALMDEVIDSIEEASDQAEGVADAARDLEKAGRRRERESDTDDLMEALAAFDDDAFDEETPLAGGDTAEPVRHKKEPAQPEPEE
jgi:hypothetical protein